MSLRISSALFSLGLLAACGVQSPEPEGDLIECAIGPGAEFARVCTLEMIKVDQFTIHHPGGGFRRFVRHDGGIEAIDGAEELSIDVEGEGGETQYSIGVDSYRIPAFPAPRLSE